MFDDFFSFGNAGPLLFIFFGTVFIGFVTAVCAISARLRADPELETGESQTETDASIAVLVISGVVSILGAYLYHTSQAFVGVGEVLTIVGIFLLWPISAVLALRRSGVGRRILLFGNGVIAAFMALMISAILIHR